MLDSKQLDFEQIYAQYQPKILRYLSRLTGDREAEDLAQEVFVKVSRGLDTFRGESQLSTWLYRIASNAAIDKLRSAAFRQHARETALGDDCEGPAKALWTGEDSHALEQILLQKDRFDCFVSFVRKLPLNYRMVVMLSEMEEMPCQEIAEILGVSQETVKIRLHRGRVRLLQELKAHCKAEEWL
jgi:RNA polymerase sigma-70 factor, ECF subfamily